MQGTLKGRRLPITVSPEHKVLCSRERCVPGYGVVMNQPTTSGRPATASIGDSSERNRHTSMGSTASDTFSMSPPMVTMPRGGGAIRGIGEKVSANPVTGTGSMSVPIATSPGRSGFGPQLSISYDSGNGNGIFGFGWTLSLPSITRKAEKRLPQYSDEDVLVLSGAEDLVPVLIGGRAFARV